MFFLSDSFKHIIRSLKNFVLIDDKRNFYSVAYKRTKFFILPLLLLAYTYLLIGLILIMTGPNIDKKRSNIISEFGCNIPRADIIDRNGIVLATSIVTASLYANTNDIIDATEAAEKLSKIFGETTFEKIYEKLISGKSFVWLARHITPKKQNAINNLGLPGIYLKKDYKRVYPLDNFASHVIGFCNIDGIGLSGIENYFDDYLNNSTEPLKLALDVRVSRVVIDVLGNYIKEFKACGANAIVMDIGTGEIVAMESLPCIDLNSKNGRLDNDSLFNKNTLGLYEPGSVFKVLNTVIALESGTAKIDTLFDAREPVKIGRFLVSDFRGKNKVLTLADAFIYSSNIAAIKIAQNFGVDIQKKFFEKFGVFKQTFIELPEIGKPTAMRNWSEASMAASSYGYGISLSPLSLLKIINGLVNNGISVNPTLLNKKAKYETDNFKLIKDILEPVKEVYERKTLISQNTSKILRKLMREVAIKGTARKADVPGYQVFGKTGTSYKNKNGVYNKNEHITFFVGGFPYYNPKYIVLVMFDDPKATETTFGFATAGWNATPCAGEIIKQIAPILDIKQQNEEDNMQVFVKLESDGKDRFNDIDELLKNNN